MVADPAPADDDIKLKAGRIAAEICEDLIMQRMDNAVQIGIKFAARKHKLSDAFVAEGFAMAIKHNLPRISSEAGLK